MTTREFVLNRLLSYPRFQADPAWPFRALNMVNQREVYSAIRFIRGQQVSSGTHEELTAGALLEFMEEGCPDATAEVILRKYYPMIGRNIREVKCTGTRPENTFVPCMPLWVPHRSF